MPDRSKAPLAGGTDKTDFKLRNERKRKGDKLGKYRRMSRKKREQRKKQINRGRCLLLV